MRITAQSARWFSRIRKKTLRRLQAATVGPSVAPFGEVDIEHEFQYDQNFLGPALVMTLDKIPFDTLARVASVEAADQHGLRLMEMGIVPGARIRVVKAAPLGDPIQVCVHDYHLALRRSEARSITVLLEPARDFG